LSFRTAILLRRRCTIYPRTLEKLPVPKETMAKRAELSRLARNLRNLSSRIRNRWNLIDKAIENATKKRLSTFPLDFSTWTDKAEGNIELVEIDGKNSLTMVDDEGVRSLLYLAGPLDLLKTVKYLLSEDDDQKSKISPDILQRLEVPENYADVSQMIDNAENPDSPEIVQFRRLLGIADEIIENTFGLSASERAYIHKRLDESPLSVFMPRYPWIAGAHHQKTRVYRAATRFG
jgi:hypothetical protein